MPGRTSPFQTSVSGMSDGSDSYRYGFNGKENDFEPKNGQGSQQDYGMRIYDPRLGKFLSVDPIAFEYPWNSTYAFAEGSPLENIDLDGLEKLNYRLIKEESGNLKLELLSIEDKYDDGGAKFNIEYEGKHYTFEEKSKYGSAYGSYSTEQMGAFFKDPDSDAWDSDEKKADKIDSELARNAIWATATEAVNFGKGYRGARSSSTKSKTNTVKRVDATGGTIVKSTKEYLTVKKGKTTFHINEKRVKEFDESPTNSKSTQGGDAVNFKKKGVPEGSEIIKGEKSGKGHKRKPTDAERKMFNENKLQ